MRLTTCLSASCFEAAGVPLGLFRPLQVNSDYGNFAHATVPTYRLVEGLNNHSAETRHLLTPLDRHDAATRRNCFVRRV